MRDQGIPEGWSTGEASRIGDANQFPKSPLPGVPDSQIPPQTELQEQQLTPSPKRQEWMKNWLFWAGLGSLISGGVGFIAMALLLKLPSSPNCPAIFWPLASASVRLHCAQVAANKQTVDDLLRAIALVQALPKGHALRPEINRLLEQWSIDILDLGEEEFQAGNLQKALAIAERIPNDVPADQTVENRISRWQSVWSEAEGIYQKAEDQLRQQQWHEAFRAAVLLLNVGNNYWETTKYNQLNRLIEATREDAKKLAKAESLAQRGGLTNLLEAIKLAESIGASSYIYQDAKDTIPEYGRNILDLAQAALDRRDAQEAIAIANQIPKSTNLEDEAQDFVTLAEAWQSAWIGTIPDLEGAIATAQKIQSDRPLYNKAQELTARWQLEIEDVAHLERARQMALQGTIGDLTAAIAEAELVPDTNPRALEARQEINRWRRQVETIEDRPYLNRAEDLAVLEDINSLQAAINEASQIARGRALYSEAQRKIGNWTRQIQRIQDQPYLDQAQLLASNGNLLGAISAAQQIQPGRALSSQAQAAINDWRGQIQARLNWQEARQVALQGTPNALEQAIRLANRVPKTSPLRLNVNAAINQWSQQILRIARRRGEYDIPGGIAIAKQIPRGTDAYRAAQEQIEIWEKFLNPEPQTPIDTPEVISN